MEAGLGFRGLGTRAVDGVTPYPGALSWGRWETLLV